MEEPLSITITIMSGVEDGRNIDLSTAEGHGTITPELWTLSIGRSEARDIILQKDTFISREHARLRYHEGRWWLEDCDSKNGTFIETPDDERRVTEAVMLEIGQLFRIGRTWLRLQMPGTD